MRPVAILDRPDALGIGHFTEWRFAEPLDAWAWLHTLRTGERPKYQSDIDKWAMEEKLRVKDAEYAKPRLFKPRVVQKLRSQKRRPNPGPSVA